MKTVMAVVVLMLGVLVYPTQASTDSGARLPTVEKLIEISSAAKKVEQSDNTQAKARRNEARELYKQARELSLKDDHERANELLNQAAKAMMEAVRMLGKDESLVVKDKNDFERREESLHALLAAYDRITKEKGIDPGRLHQVVERQLSEAKRLKTSGRVVEGRDVLDKAYVATKVAIEQLRGGDTLVRTLHFESKEEEYHYEVDRNDTHKMLVTLLLKEEAKSGGKGRLVEQFMSKAAKVRDDAEKKANQGNYEAAVEIMEQSTKQIIRAIRSAGIYIPE